MNLFTPKRASTVLGLSLDGNRLEAAIVRRSGDALQIRQTVAAALALSPLTGDPELVGREIRNHLDKSGINERRCAVCLPLSWVLQLQTKVPEMPEADVAGYLQIEAERGFPSGYEALFVANSRFKSPDGGQYATMLAVPKNNLDLLERALKAAKLKPVTFALGISALQSPAAEAAKRVLALSVGIHGLDLQVSGGGGVIALRSLDSAVETEGARRSVASDMVAREIRITLGQLPGGYSEGPGPVNVFGQGEMARQFVTEMTPRLAVFGLKVEAMERAGFASFANSPPADLVASPALALAAAYVKGSNVGAEFLRPRVAPWQQFVNTKLSTQKLAYGGGAAACAVFCVAALFGWQQFRISRLNAQWDTMSKQVTALQDAQAKIAKYRPWYDESCRGLTILSKLVSAFPDDGTITAKRVEVHDLTTVSCDGTARNLAALDYVRENLSKFGEIGDSLHSETRGQVPAIQFNLNFQWQPEGATSNGN